jgi:5,10-methylenetetrahydromethanopterin reductase
MEMAVTFASSMDTPEHIRIAESLGYTQAWCFASPAIYVDTFTILGLAATKTTSIGLGPGVMVPHLRHVADGATALATLDALAPGRVRAIVGSGFSATALLNRKSIPWSHVEAYVTALRDLLAGREIEWDGTRFGLLHTGTMGIKLPIEIPIWVAAHGPKGFAVAERVADGIITNPTHGDEPIPYSGTFAVQFYGTVLDDDEPADSPRAVAAAGPGAALALHLGPYGPVAGTEEEVGFAAKIAEFPPERRLVETHRCHLAELSDSDRPFVTERVIRQGTMTGTRAEMRETLKGFEATGAAMFVYSPFGPDIPRELETFAEVANL